MQEYCSECGQKVIWESGINAGCTRTLLKIAEALRTKKHNIINPKKEMLDKDDLTVSEYNNLTHVVRHGLLARSKGEPGNVSLTTKGIEYMEGKPIARVVYVRKTTEGEGSHKVGESDEQVTIDQVMKGEYWSQPNVEIREGRVIDKYPLKEKQGVLLDVPAPTNYPS